MAEQHPDKIIRFLFDNCAVRGVWVQLQQSLSEMLLLHPIEHLGSQHRTLAASLLGESLAAAALMSCMVKMQGRVSLQARGGNNPDSKAALKLLVAECTHDYALRGTIELDGEKVTADQSLAALLDDGYLAVTLLPEYDDGSTGSGYQGIVDLKKARLQDGLSEYFAQSAQLPTTLWLASDGERAAGLLLQAMPGDDDSDSDDLLTRYAHNDDWQRVNALANTVSSRELLSWPCEELLHKLFHEDQVRIYPADPLSFRCTCSEERARNSLAILGREDLKALFVERPVVDIDCHFCHRKYRYTAADMDTLLGEAPDEQPVLH